MNIDAQAALYLKSGGIVAYPTESFFALGVDATNAAAVRSVFRLKGRRRKPIALIAADARQVKKYFYISADEARLMKKYWPGAVTILLRPRKMIAAGALTPTTPNPFPEQVRDRLSGRGAVLVGVRVPGHAGARRLAQRAGAPLTATSANITGRPPTKSAGMIKKLFPDILVGPGRCGRKLKPSTVVRLDKRKITILRQGSAHVLPATS